MFSPIHQDSHPNSLIMTTQQPHKKSIGVFALQFDGMGDIVGGAKVASAVQQLFPDYEIIFSIVQPSLSSMERMMFESVGNHKIDAKKLPAFTNITFCGEAELPKRIHTFSCMILYPTYHDSTIPSFIQMANIPMLRLREYGVGQPTKGAVEGTTYPLGVGQEDYGLLLDSDLYTYGEEHRCDHSLQRLNQLKDLPPNLTQIILGAPFTQKSLEAFDQNNKLFSGYGYNDSAIIDFIETLCTFNSTNDLTICLLNHSIPNVQSHIRKILFEKHFKEFSIYTPNEEQKWDCKRLSFNEKAKGNRTLKLIFAKLKPSDSLTLAKASEPQTLTTGDQSFIERLLLRHYPLYDCRPHKIPFILSFIEFSKQIDPQFATLLKTSIFGELDPLEILQMTDEGIPVDHFFYQPNLVDYFNQLSHDPELSEKWNNLVSYLYQKHNAKDLLQPIIAETLSTSNDLL